MVAAATPSGEHINFAKSAFRTLTGDWVKLLVVGMHPGVDGPWHWLSRGVVAVYLAVVAVYLANEPDRAHLPPRSTLTRSGRNWRLDVHVSPIDVQVPAADQTAAIADSVNAAIQLRQWCLATLAEEPLG